MSHYIEIKPTDSAVCEITVRQEGRFLPCLSINAAYSKRGLLELVMFEYSTVPGLSGRRIEGLEVLGYLADLLGYERFVPDTLIDRTPEYAAACDLFSRLSTQPPAKVAA